jgi:hypothetical protein
MFALLDRGSCRLAVELGCYCLCRRWPLKRLGFRLSDFALDLRQPGSARSRLGPDGVGLAGHQGRGNQQRKHVIGLHSKNRDGSS